MNITSCISYSYRACHTCQGCQGFFTDFYKRMPECEPVVLYLFSGLPRKGVYCPSINPFVKNGPLEVIKFTGLLLHSYWTVNFFYL